VNCLALANQILNCAVMTGNHAEYVCNSRVRDNDALSISPYSSQVRRSSGRVSLVLLCVVGSNKYQFDKCQN
jgi:hypothetical protein